MDSLELKHLRKLDLPDIDDEDLGWLRTLDKTTNYILSSREILHEVADGKITPWRLTNGPEGIVLLSVHTSNKKRTLEVEALAGRRAPNYIQGIWSDLLKLAEYVDASELIFTAENSRFGDVIANRCDFEEKAKTYTRRLK